MRILIVGGGVAGISLAFGLKKRQVEVTLMDKGHNVSSAVAAGLINPLVFRRMTLSWRLAELLPFAAQFYRELEQTLDVSFFHEITIRRLFASDQEREFWLKKQDQVDFQPYLEQLTEVDLNFPLSENTFGTGRVKQAYYVDTESFLTTALNRLKQENTLIQEDFDYDQLQPVDGTYKGETYDYIIFCEGKDGKYNPYFSYLPLQQTKGEVLTLASSEISEQESLNRKCFLLPVGKGQFKVGSTYVWNTDNTEITEEGKQTILANLKSITSLPYEVKEQRAGVRPTVLDRRPLLGKHPEFPQLVIANGLGTKGYMLAPKIMDEVIEHLLNDVNLDSESTISRFNPASPQ